MPFLRIEVNHAVDSDAVQRAISRSRQVIHEIKGDPESMISVVIHTGVGGVFGTANGQPMANVQLISFDLNPDITARLTRQLSDILWTELRVPADFAYLFFSNVEAPHLTSWNGRTFAEILQQQTGSREELQRRLRGRLVNRPKVARAARQPLGGLRLELWDPNPVVGISQGTTGQNVSRLLASGVTSPDGFFEIFFNRPTEQARLPEALSLRIYEPDQLVVVGGQPVRRRFVAAVQPIIDNGSPDLAVGQIDVEFYEYDPSWPFPYAVPSSIRQKFSPAQEANYAESQQFATIIGLRLFGAMDSSPEGLSITDVQSAFPSNQTLDMEKQNPGSSRADDFFAQRLLNNMAPPLFRIDPNDRFVGPDPNVYMLEYNWKVFQRRPDLTLLSFRARFTSDKNKLQPLDIWIGLNQNDDPRQFTRFSPADGEKWQQAKRVVRSTYNNLLGQFQGHLGVSHFNMEQYGIAFLRSIKSNPVRQLMYPFIREILAINEKGRYTLLGGPGIVFEVEPISRTSVSQWIVNTLGRLDWKGWKPRRPLCSGHGYAYTANLYWKLVGEVVYDFFTRYEAGIRANWSEIKRFSDDLVENSVQFAPAGLEDAPNSGAFYCTNEVSQGGREGQKAIQPVTTGADNPTRTDLENLAQVCNYIIFHCTLFHSWAHLQMLTDLGELRYSGMLRNGGMGPENDDRFLAPPREATFALGSTHTLSGMKCGYLIRNEDGDSSTALIEKLSSNRAQFQAWGFNVDRLCARLNT